MILNQNEIFSNKQAITATALSTNVIDLGLAGTPYGAAAPVKQDIGKGTPIPILVTVTEAFATLTSLTITLECSAAAGMTSPEVLFTSPAIPLAELVVGEKITLQFIPIKANLRYLGLRYTVAGSSATAGKIMAAITMGNQTND